MGRQKRQFMRQGVGDLPTRAIVEAYVGAAGEPIFDFETLRMHDGATPGGIVLATKGDVTSAVTKLKGQATTDADDLGKVEAALDALRDTANDNTSTVDALDAAFTAAGVDKIRPDLTSLAVAALDAVQGAIDAAAGAIDVANSKLGTTGDGSGVQSAAKWGAITAPYKRTLQSHFGDMANLLDMVPDQTGATDVIAKMHAIRQDSPFRPFFVPPGQYLCSTPLPVIDGPPLSIHGVGSNGAGPGSFEYNNATLFMLQFAQGDAFTAQTAFPCVFENFRIETHPAYRNGYNPGSGAISNTGYGIRIAGSPNTNQGSIVRGVAFVEKNGVRQYRAVGHRIEACYFLGWIDAGILSDTDTVNEGGGGWYEKNVFQGFSGTAAQQAARGPSIFARTGYFTASRNLIAGASIGIKLSITNHAAGSPRIIDNVIEDQWTAGIWCESADGNVASMLVIDRNEFSIVDARPNLLGSIVVIDRANTQWLKGFSIDNNVFRNNFQSVPTTGFIHLGAGVGGTINNNRLTNLYPGAQSGIRVSGFANSDSLAGPIEARNNFFFNEAAGASWSDKIIAPAGLVLVEDKQPLTLAQFSTYYPLMPANGSSFFISDGTPGGAPLVGGGPGSRALVASGQLVGR